MDDIDKQRRDAKLDQGEGKKEPHHTAPKPTRITITDNTVEPDPDTVTDDPAPDPVVVALNEAEKEPEIVSETTNTSPASDKPLSMASRVNKVGSTKLLKVTKNKRLTMMAAAGVLLSLIAGLLAWSIFAGDNSEPVETLTEEVSSAPIAQPILGISVTVSDGMVEFIREGAEWAPVDLTTELKEGDTVRTGTDGRAVLTVEDGTVVRLDDMTTVKIISLAANKIEITQLDGTLYSRVVPSDRQYIVSLDGSTYEALGTAFATYKSLQKSGVRVFQSAVRASEVSEGSVTEGREFFRPFGDYVGPLKVSDINIDTFVDDDFIQWNIAEDEKDDTFKEKLGVLPRIKQRSEEIRKQRQIEQEAKEITEKAATEKAAEATQAAQEKRMSSLGAKFTRGEMALGVDKSERKLHWTYTGDAIYGYKVVYSKTNREPSVEKDASIHFRSMDETSGTLPSREEIGGGKFYVRVCAYTSNTQREPCVDYSNFVVVNM